MLVCDMVNMILLQAIQFFLSSDVVVNSTVLETLCTEYESLVLLMTKLQHVHPFSPLATELCTISSFYVLMDLNICRGDDEYAE